MTTTTATWTECPANGKRVYAQTTTATAQTVVIEVTAFEEETKGGWLVYGIRQRRGARGAVRSTLYPNLYFVAKAVSA